MRRIAGLAVLVTASIGLAPAETNAAGGTVVSVFPPFTYSPDPTEIGAGEGLTFLNGDGASGEGHSLSHAADPARFTTPILPAGSSGPVAGVENLAAGEYPFTCLVHPFMHGLLVVK